MDPSFIIDHCAIIHILNLDNHRHTPQAFMSILSSREHSCVNPQLAKSSDKNEKCRDLRKDSKFYDVTFTLATWVIPTVKNFLWKIQRFWPIRLFWLVLLFLIPILVDACKYGRQSDRMNHPAKLVRQGINQAWDVEELAELGRKIESCSYYASVSLVSVVLDVN